MRDSLRKLNLHYPQREPEFKYFKRLFRMLYCLAKFYYCLAKLYFHEVIQYLSRNHPKLFLIFGNILTFVLSNKDKMDSIIHQATPTNENQAELTPLTQPNDGPTGKSGQGRSGRNSGGFLRSLLCCFTGGSESTTEPVLPQDPIDKPQDENLPPEPEPCPEPPIVRLI